MRPDSSDSEFPPGFYVYEYFVHQDRRSGEHPASAQKLRAEKGQATPSIKAFTVNELGRWSEQPVAQARRHIAHQEPHWRNEETSVTEVGALQQEHAPAMSSLIQSVRNGDLAEISRRLNDRTMLADIDAEDECDKSALDYAFELRNFQIAKLLVRQGAKFADDMAHDAALLTDLIDAGERHLARELAQLRVRLTANSPDDPQQDHQQWQVPLFKAIRTGNVELAVLLANPRTLSLRDETGGNALHFSANSPNPRMLPELLNRLPADVQQKQLILNAARIDGRTPLIQATIANRPTAVAALLRAGVYVDAFDQYGDSALHKAASAGHLDIGRLLLAARARTDISNRSRESPAMTASRYGRPEFVQLLQAFGV